MASSREFTKAQRGRLRELCGLAYERDLAAELARLEAAFQRWLANEIDAFELSDLIHNFHQGPSRKLFVKYSRPDLPLAVASAIHRGVLAEGEVGAEILELLGPQVAFLRDREAE